MPITIGSNLDSLRTIRLLNSNSAQAGLSYERLSSGQRINRASDDAAGLSVSMSLDANTVIARQGVRNLNDGISLLNIASSALDQLVGVVTRMRELATQASNGSFSTTQRISLNAEAQELRKEFFRVSQSTSFNGRLLFNGSVSQLAFQGGVGAQGAVVGSLGGEIGNGTLSTYSSFQLDIGTPSTDVALGDVNNDGVLDRATIGSFGSVSIALGRGDGSFATAVSYTQHSSDASEVVLGDVNGDGILDLVSLGTNATPTVSWRLGNGSGTFGSVVSRSFGSGPDQPQALALADLNRDGRAEILAGARVSGSGRVSVFSIGASGAWESTTTISTGLSNAQTVAVGDLNGDGIFDIVSGADGGGAGKVSVSMGSGNGTYATAVSYALFGTSTAGVQIGDVNGDGRSDIVGVSSGGVAGVLINSQGTGTFGTAVSYSLLPVGGAADIFLNDLNGDGILDMTAIGSSGAQAGIATRFGRGDGTFGASTSIISQNTLYFYGGAFGDIDGDSVLDFVGAGEDFGFSGFGESFLGGSTAGINPLLDFDLTSIAGSRQAFATLDNKRTALIKQRGEIGALQSRLSVAAGALFSAKDQYEFAGARIRDVDVAKEAAEATRLSILRQTSASVLAQANTKPRIALQLLGIGE